jgi:hypothetical protein
MKQRVEAIALILVFLFGLRAWAGNIDDVTFLRKIQVYEAVVDTTLVTQEGNRIKITKGTRLNVVGFTPVEALVVSRKDKPNVFVRRNDIAPVNQ